MEKGFKQVVGKCVVGDLLISACILIRSMHGRYEKVVEEIKQINGVKKTFPVLGRYDVVVDFEAPDYMSLGNSVLRMGMLSGVVFTETLVEISHKKR